LNDGVKIIDIQDDGFSSDASRAHLILEKLAKLRESYEFEFMATNGLNPKLIGHEFAKLLKSAGAKKIDLSLGTGGFASRDFFKRPENIADYERALSCLVSAGISVTTYFILGFPTQPIADMKATFEYLKNKPTLISPSVFYNVPGMPIYSEMRRFENSHDTRSGRSSAFNCLGADFSREDIVNLFSKIRIHNLNRFHS
jgi:radical SAM superfamily enzyme YgiQ (UPF0313 family)